MFTSSTGRRRAGRMLVGVALGVTLLAGVTRPASADPFGTGTGAAGMMQDNQLVDYCFYDRIQINPLVDSAHWRYWSTIKDAVVAAMANLDSQTTMDIQYRSSCRWGSTDIIFEIDLYGRYASEWRCDDPVPGSKVCDQANVLFNPIRLTSEMPDEMEHDSAAFKKNARKAACHEIGLAVGLEQGADKEDCMVLGDVTWWDHDQVTTYDQHHVSHIASDAWSPW